MAKSSDPLGVKPGIPIAIMTYNAPESLEVHSALGYLEVGPVMAGYSIPIWTFSADPAN
jgi:hypothetical protein